jgi:hypothetical protein
VLSVWLACFISQGAQSGPELDPLSAAAQLVAHTGERELVDQLLDDGRHQRFGTRDEGPVQVWRPRGHKQDTAATIAYVHGFFTEVDCSRGYCTVLR